ncbi:hypothetical protein M422DRAFT_27286 [Sphaerobolus stellatus SS14]|nr:hypothetical protein M422DRAFT_27286 [Sphaerobolus stellatus SS14]
MYARFVYVAIIFLALAKASPSIPGSSFRNLLVSTPSIDNVPAECQPACTPFNTNVAVKCDDSNLTREEGIICLCTQQALDATESCLECLVEIGTQEAKTASQQGLNALVTGCSQAGHAIDGVSSAPTLTASPGSGVPTATPTTKASNDCVAVLTVKGTVAVLAFAGGIALL